jgi:uncharacterized protein
MAKRIHEFRDPIHQFIRLDSDERRVIDSQPFQRLRHIHQLALTYLIYPGATHRRFEHSLGVMELAARVYDSVTQPHKLHEAARHLVPDKGSEEDGYWRRALRVAALCHDMGHLPFSHAAENELLPDHWDHEALTGTIIRSKQMEDLWNSMTPPLRSADIIKIAIGPKRLPNVEFSEWEEILSEMIVGDAFGVDRMDYLLRDSYHLGVTYGLYDRHRLIDTLRILPRKDRGSGELSLGTEAGGLESSVALMLARYFMFKQVYFHPVRRIYDIHLKEFLKDWLGRGVFSTEVRNHLRITDNDVLVGIAKAASRRGSRGHAPAERIATRTHFKLLYERNPTDYQRNPAVVDAILAGAAGEFGLERLRIDRYHPKVGLPDFPVMQSDGRIESSLNVSEAIRAIPTVVVDYVFVDGDILSDARRWLRENLEAIVEQGLGGQQ